MAEFNKTFNGGTFLPIITTGWKGKNVVKFNTEGLYQINGSYLAEGTCGDSTGACGKYNNGFPFDQSKCIYDCSGCRTDIPGAQTCLNNTCLLTSNNDCKQINQNVSVLYSFPGTQCGPSVLVDLHTEFCDGYCEDCWTCGFSCQKIALADNKISNTKTILNVVSKDIGKCIIDDTLNFNTFELPDTNDGSNIEKPEPDPNNPLKIYGPNHCWSLDTSNFPSYVDGYIQMQLSLFKTFDFKNNFPVITTNSFFNLLDLCNNLSGTLPPTLITFLSVNSYVYCYASLFYDNIYQHNIKPNDNMYLSYNCINLTDFNQTFANTFMYPLNLPPVPTFVAGPEPEQDNDNYFLTFSLSYQQILDFLQKTGDLNSPDNRMDFMNKFANNFLRDNEGSIQEPQSLVPFTNASFTFADDMNYLSVYLDAVSFKSYSYIHYTKDSISYYPNTNLLSKMYYKNYVSDSIEDVTQIVSIQIKLKVETWSIMLLAYFEKNGTFTYSENAISKIVNDTQTLPYSYFKGTKEQIVKYCPNTYRFTSNNFLSNGSLSTYVINSGTPNACKCYTSYLTPPDIGFPNDSAMCFDTYCSADILNTIGVKDSFCSSKVACQDVYNWTNAQSTHMSSNPGELNKAKYEQYCGLYIPIKSGIYNLNVLIFGTFFTLLLTLFAYLLCKNKNYESFKTFSICFIVLSISSVSTYYLSKYLNGSFICDGKTKICQSALTSTTIPTEFCDDTGSVSCDCQVPSDCPKNCDCRSGQCRPVNGKTYTVEEYKIKWVTIVFSTIMSIIFPLVFVYASEDYNWHVNKKLAIAFVVLLSLSPITYTFITSLQKIKVSKYDKC